MLRVRLPGHGEGALDSWLERRRHPLTEMNVVLGKGMATCLATSTGGGRWWSGSARREHARRGTYLPGCPPLPMETAFAVSELPGLRDAAAQDARRPEGIRRRLRLEGGPVLHRLRARPGHGGVRWRHAWKDLAGQGVVQRLDDPAEAGGDQAPGPGQGARWCRAASGLLLVAEGDHRRLVPSPRRAELWTLDFVYGRTPG